MISLFGCSKETNSRKIETEWISIKMEKEKVIKIINSDMLSLTDSITIMVKSIDSLLSKTDFSEDQKTYKVGSYNFICSGTKSFELQSEEIKAFRILWYKRGEDNLDELNSFIYSKKFGILFRKYEVQFQREPFVDRLIRYKLEDGTDLDLGNFTYSIYESFSGPPK